MLGSQGLKSKPGGSGPPAVLLPEAPPFRPKVVSSDKANCQAGFALKKKSDLFQWKPEHLPGILH